VQRTAVHADGLRGPVEIRRDRRRRQAQQGAVAVAVHRDSVPGGRDLREQRAGAAHLLADHEERGPRGVLAQQLEHGRRAARMRPVVEGQRDRTGQRDPPREAQRGAHGRCDRSQRGRAPGGPERPRACRAGADRAGAGRPPEAGGEGHVREPYPSRATPPARE
jgi:hypothetical protein